MQCWQSPSTPWIWSLTRQFRNVGLGWIYPILVRPSQNSFCGTAESRQSFPARSGNLLFDIAVRNWDKTHEAIPPASTRKMAKFCYFYDPLPVIFYFTTSKPRLILQFRHFCFDIRALDSRLRRGNLDTFDALHANLRATPFAVCVSRQWEMMHE